MRAVCRSAADVVAHIESGQTVGLMHACGEPQALVDALVARANALRGVRILTGWHGVSQARYALPEFADVFTPVTTLPSNLTARAIAEGRGEFLDLQFGQLARSIRDRTLRVDVALVQVSPPDADGRCSLGVSVDYARELLDAAPVRLAQINGRMPRTTGDALVPFDVFDAAVRIDEPLLSLDSGPPTAQDNAIAKAIAPLIPDGATLQVGVGSMPNAVLHALANHKDLGVHSGMVSDAMVDLVRDGVITGRKKTVDPCWIVAGGAIGSQRLFDAIPTWDALELRSATYTHDPDVIAALDRFVGINGAVEVDLGGNVNAEVVGGRRISGPGGQPEFAAGAHKAKDGQCIIALPSTSRQGDASRIVARLGDGVPITTPGAHVTAVVTEYGAADLRGLNARARARALAAIAHPDYRADLLRAAEEY